MPLCMGRIKNLPTHRGGRFPLSRIPEVKVGENRSPTENILGYIGSYPLEALVLLQLWDWRS